MTEKIEDKLKRLQKERESAAKDREDVQDELLKTGARLKHLRDGQKERQRKLDDEQKRQNNEQKRQDDTRTSNDGKSSSV